MGTLRQNPCKAPNVGDNGVPSGDAGKIYASGDDTTLAYLYDELQPGIGLRTRLVEELPSGSGDEKVQVYNNVQTLDDSFTIDRPLWECSEAIRSGDWSRDDTGEYLEGDAATNSYNRFRYGIEGNFDYSFHFFRDSNDIGFKIQNPAGTVYVEIEYDGADITISANGETPVTQSYTGAIVWLRITRENENYTFYYRASAGREWNAIGTFVKEMGVNTEAYLLSSIGAYIYQARLIDNMYGVRLRSGAELEYPLTDASTIAVDASLANTYTVTLGGNRTMGAPTNPTRNQKIMFKIKQDGTGSRTLAWNAIYRFSGDIPSPTITTDADHWDYIGFRYDEADNKWDCIALVQDFS